MNEWMIKWMNEADSLVSMISVLGTFRHMKRKRCKDAHVTKQKLDLKLFFSEKVLFVLNYYTEGKDIA